MRFSSEFTTPLAGIEDPVACGLHLAGAVFFAWQARKLVRRAGIARRRAAALAIFAGSGVLVLGISAFYHGLAVDHPWKAAFQRADHAAIFLLIAGTLTPYHAIGFHGRGRWWMVGGTWVIALVALVLKTVFWSDVGDGLGLCLYVGLAAIGLGAVLVLPRRLPTIWTSAGSCRAGSAPTRYSTWRC
jgi:channel protein (hemolysin III family)